MMRAQIPSGGIQKRLWDTVLADYHAAWDHMAEYGTDGSCYAVLLTTEALNNLIRAARQTQGLPLLGKAPEWPWLKKGC